MADDKALSVQRATPDSPMMRAIDTLLAAGFVPDGQTKEEVVRVPTQASPVFGRGGGELVKFGGRQRLRLPGTGIKATVGKRTIAIYLVLGPGLMGTQGIATIDTPDSAALQRVLSNLPAQG